VTFSIIFVPSFLVFDDGTSAEPISPWLLGKPTQHLTNGFPVWLCGLCRHLSAVSGFMLSSYMIGCIWYVSWTSSRATAATSGSSKDPHMTSLLTQVWRC